MVAKVSAVSQIPPPTTVMIASVVSFPREINPLRMPELITHKVKVALTPETEGKQSDHFMEGYSSEDSGCLLSEDTHITVNFCIKQPHRDGFIPNQCLIMTLSISNCQFPVAMVAELV